MGRKSWLAVVLAAITLGTPGCVLTDSYVSSLRVSNPGPVLLAPVVLPLAVAGDLAIDSTAVALSPIWLPIGLYELGKRL